MRKTSVMSQLETHELFYRWLWWAFSLAPIIAGVGDIKPLARFWQMRLLFGLPKWVALPDSVLWLHRAVHRLSQRNNGGGTSRNWSWMSWYLKLFFWLLICQSQSSYGIGSTMMWGKGDRKLCSTYSAWLKFEFERFSSSVRPTIGQCWYVQSRNCHKEVKM